MDLGNITASMGSMSAWNLIGSTIFSGVGFVALMYGKKQGRFNLMVLGGVLMTYPYFISSTPLMFAIGAALTVAAFRLKD
jgi:hypothetical protein